MRTEKQLAASRANGRKSLGPVTPAGKFRSPIARLRQELFGRSMVLPSESRDRFDSFTRGFVEEFQPATETEYQLIEVMAAAGWRQMRLWGYETVVLTRYASLGKPAGPFLTDRIHLIEMQLQRQFHRALVLLRSLIAERRSEKIPPEPGDLYENKQTGTHAETCQNPPGTHGNPPKPKGNPGNLAAMPRYTEASYMLQAGIVGLPNVGKSTLFNAVTQTRKALAANYRFCTIEPNQGIVTVPDERLQVLSKISASQKIVPSVFEFVDIAGLVKGASTGEGLGNQFLAHIREVDAIIQVVRCFENSDIEHVMDSVDPIRDIDIVNTELILADLDSLEKRKSKQQKLAKGGDKKAQSELDLIGRLEPVLSAGQFAFSLEMSPEETALLKGFFLLTAKPTLFACNVAEEELANPDSNPWVKKVRDYAEHHHGTRAVVVSAEIESELVTLPPDEAAEYLAGLGVEQSGSGTLIREAYYLLGLRTYLTTGEKETRAWTIRAGDKAPQAAGVIHSDFEKSFISAETVSYTDLVACGSFARARELGKLRTEGKEYVVQDGDVIEFKTFL